MDGAGLDALVICSRGDEFMRGRVQYVSDIFQWAGWGIVVLPRSGDGAFIADPLWGVGRARLVGWHSDVRSSHSPGDEIAELLADRGVADGEVGVVGLADITLAAHFSGMKQVLPRARFRDATDLFDDVRAVKSPMELANLAETSAILRSVYRSLEAELRPGVTHRDVMAEAHRLARQYGCLDGIAQMATRPFTALMFSSSKTLQQGDVIAIDLEWAGPSGYWVELRRNYSLGRVPDDARRYWDTRVETFEACSSVMKAGNSSAEVLAARDRAYRRHGQDGQGILSYTAHGIGIDSLEPPWVPGKDRVLRENMVVSLHPAIQLADPGEHAALGCIAIADNVLVTATGGQRMTDQADVWIELEA